MKLSSNQLSELRQAIYMISDAKQTLISLNVELDGYNDIASIIEDLNNNEQLNKLLKEL